MKPIEPKVNELILSDKRKNQWKFDSRPPPSGNRASLAERIWWVNKHTMIHTSVKDPCSSDAAPLPPGITVFAPLVTRAQMRAAIQELRALFKRERAAPTLTGFHMSKQKRDSYILFYPEDSAERSPPASAVIEALSELTPHAAVLLSSYCDSVRELLALPPDRFDQKSTIGIIQYDRNAGIPTHIDNVTRLGGSAGPVFTLSLGGGGVKLMDMFPVIEPHHHRPVRIQIPRGGVVLMDGVARLQWSHGIPHHDPTERFTVILQFEELEK